MGWKTSSATAGLVECADAVNDAARDGPDVAGTEHAGHPADGEFELPLQQVTHLLVGMGVVEHDRFGLQPNDREHHVRARGRADLDARKDDVPRTRTRRDEVRIGDSRRGLVVACSVGGH